MPTSRSLGDNATLHLLLGVVFTMGVIVAVAFLSANTDDAENGNFPGGRALFRTTTDILVTVVVVLSVAMLVAVVVSQRLERRGDQGTPKSHFLAVLVTATLCIGGIAMLANNAEPSADPLVLEVPEVGVGIDERPRPGPSDETGDESSVGFIIGLVVAAGLLSWVAYIFWIRPGQGRHEVAGEGGESEPAQRRRTLEGLLDEAIAVLRMDPDPRRAVITVWARLELALDAAGFPRSTAETPAGYLERILGMVDVSAPAARQLVQVFERAKFSPHDIGVEDQNQAVDALVTVRDELRAVTSA